MTDIPIRFLNREDVVASGGRDMVRAVRDVERALGELRSGDAVMIPESALPLAGRSPARAYALPARVGGAGGVAGVKWVAYGERDGAPGPAALSLTLINDARSGRPLACVESGLLTAVRTAAVSAIALRTITPAPAGRVALIGAGLQAHAHLRMLRECTGATREVLVWSRTASRTAEMIARTAGSGPPQVRPVESLGEAVAEADVVMACTSSELPIIGRGAVRPGRTLMQIGYNEVTFGAIDACDHVVVDLWGEFRLTSAKSLFQMHRAGRFPASRVAADLPCVLYDGWAPAPGSSVYFSSFGLNILDIALAARVVETAEARGIGSSHFLSGASDGTWAWP